MNIREATLEDALDIAKVHVSSWQTAYKGLMPDEVIASRTVEIREKHAKSAIKNDEVIVLVAELDDEIVGFATGGRPQYQHITYDSELYAIYLIQEAQGQGIGRALVQAFAEQAIGKGYKNTMLWVLNNNENSRRFYEKLGGVKVDTGTYQVTKDISLQTIAYGWQDIHSLVKED